MTFYEAAIEILKESGRPLHYKKITEIAIDRKLLSHIGKTPEQTMQSRLLEEADRKQQPTIIKVRPGVFGLAQGLDVDKLSRTLRRSTPVGPTVPIEAPDPKPASDAAPRRRDTGRSDTGRSDTGRSDTGRSDTGRSDTGRSDTGRGRRSRRRRRRNGPTGETETAAEPKPERPTRPSKRSRPDSRRVAKPEVSERSQSTSTTKALLEPLTLALKRSRGAVTSRDLAKRVSNDSRSVEASDVDVILMRANQQAQATGQHPRFLRRDRGWTFTERELGAELAAHYQAFEAARDRILDATQKLLTEKAARLTAAKRPAVVEATLRGLGYLLTPLEQSEGWIAWLAVGGRGALAPRKAAVCLFLDEKPLGREAIAAFRGRLHRYGAPEGVAITLHQAAVADEVSREAATSETLPITILDASRFGALALEAGVGVQHYRVDVPLLDLAPERAWPEP